jgi:tRNA dimethylallyltransferase
MVLSDLEAALESQAPAVTSDYPPARLAAGVPWAGIAACESDAAMASATPGIHHRAGSNSLPDHFPVPAGGLVDALDAVSSPGEYPLLVIVGPTASGKSALAVRVALAFGGEVVNFDSVQLYRGFDVGSGKLGIAERRGIPHHLLDVAEGTDTFTAGDYRREASRALEDIRGRGRLPIMAGGTGLYLRALLLGLFDGPRRSVELRRRLGSLAEGRGGDILHRMLARKDPASAARIHRRDTQKVIRALEVCLLRRRPFSELLEGGREPLQGFGIRKIGLSPPREQLVQRIDARVVGMFAGGIIDEVRSALGRGKESTPVTAPLEALGYRQARAYVEANMSREEAIREAQARTRQYAKRQMTWFRREPGVHWFRGFGNDVAVEQQVFRWLECSLAGHSPGWRKAASS